MEVCSEPGCSRPREKRGLCGACYQRLRLLDQLPTEYEPGGRGYGRGRPMPRTQCSAEGCDRIADRPTAGLCKAHYAQRWRGEELRPLKGSQRSAEYWLLTHREIDAVTGCWLWTGNRDSSGYGQFHMNDRMNGVHRIAYELWVGPRDGDTIHHKCAVRRCFNPEHLELATRRDNALEMHERRAYRRKIRALETRIAELEAELEARWPVATTTA